jgi:hypothetical protein
VDRKKDVSSLRGELQSVDGMAKAKKAYSFLPWESIGWCVFLSIPCAFIWRQVAVPGILYAKKHAPKDIDEGVALFMQVTGTRQSTLDWLFKQVTAIDGTIKQLTTAFIGGAWIVVPR